MLTPAKLSIRFTGYPDGSAKPNVVICHITRGALEYLCGEPNIGAEKMLHAFNAHLSEIRAAACSMFETGTAEPVISEDTLKSPPRT